MMDFCQVLGKVVHGTLVLPADLALVLLCGLQEDDECTCPHIGRVPHNEVLTEVAPSEVMNHPILAFDLAEGALFHLGVGSMTPKDKKNKVHLNMIFLVF